MNDEKDKDIVKVKEEYLRKHEEITDFLITRKVLRTILIWFTVISAVIFLGLGSFVNYSIKKNIEDKISKVINEEKEFLKTTNEISRMSDEVIISGDVSIYKELKKIRDIVSFRQA